MKVVFERRRGYDLPDGCFLNVALLIRDVGGRAVFGWSVSPNKNPDPEMEALIHHVVWQRPDGGIVDPTPNHEGLAFRPDPSATYEGLTRPARFVAVRPEFEAVAAHLNRSERWTVGADADADKANYWRGKADQAYKRVAGKPLGMLPHTRQYVDQFRRVQHPRADEILPYLAA